jgi:hypothetical protein
MPHFPWMAIVALAPRTRTTAPRGLRPKPHTGAFAEYVAERRR